MPASSFLFRNLLSSLAVSLCLSLGFTAPSLAQDGFNPFWKDQFKTKPKPKQTTPPNPTAQPQKPYLEPMQDRPRFDAGGNPNAGANTGPRDGQGWRRQDPYAGAAQPGAAIQGAGQPGVSGRAVERAPLGELDRSVDSNALGPVMAGAGLNGGGLPYNLWQGVTVRQVEQLIAALTIPPRSTIVHDLWKRIITSNATPPAPGEATVPFAAVQSEALFRSGLLTEAHDVLVQGQTDGQGPGRGQDQALGQTLGQAQTPAKPSALSDALNARAAISAKQARSGCPIAKQLVRRLSALPKSLTGTASLMIGYCAVHDNNKAAAGLAADLAEDNGAQDSAGIAALRAFSVDTKPVYKSNARMTVIDFRIIELAGGVISRGHLTNAKAPLLAAVALSQTVPLELKIAAAEAALKLNALSLRDMTDIYRSAASGRGAIAPAEATQGGSNFGDEANRAALYNAAETEASPLRKARNIRGFLDSSRRAGLYWHALRMMAGPANQLSTLPEIGWFAETGIETSLAAGDYVSARRWAAFAAAQRQDGGANLDHWRGLIDIADPSRAQSRLSNDLNVIESAAQRGLFEPVLLHRLATVLDALDAQVPIPLWEIASRSPQPTTGHLPETGVLSALQNAAKNKHYGHMLLLVMKTLGPNGAEGAHMIALGDSIRALKRAGLKAEARQLGVEALFSGWPRAVSN